MHRKAGKLHKNSAAITHTPYSILNARTHRGTKQELNEVNGLKSMFSLSIVLYRILTSFFFDISANECNLYYLTAPAVCSKSKPSDQWGSKTMTSFLQNNLNSGSLVMVTVVSADEAGSGATVR